MKSILCLLPILLISACSQYATIKQIQPQRAGFVNKLGNPQASLESNLSAAENALVKLDKNPADSTARGDYNFAVARICGIIQDQKLKPWKKPLRIGTRTLSWKYDPRPDWHPKDYDITPADQLDISGKYIDIRETKDGIGAPLVTTRQADQAHPHAPTPHFFYNATAVIRFEGTRCILAFEDPLNQESVRVGRHRYPLAADYTAPLASMLVEMHPKELEFPRLLHPEEFSDTTKLARLESYDPNKAVILFIHGLMDSPATWFPLMNHLRADPEVRKNYQFWFYSYPSGYPYSYSAAILRKELDHMQVSYPLKKKMVVIGHSMGGCISRILCTDSGMNIWNNMFSVPPEKMKMAPEHKHILTESNIFSHRKEIGTAIFIAAPHRGSDLASGFIGRLGNRLIKLPADMVKIGAEEAKYEKHDDGHFHLSRFPDSVDNLEPTNQFVLALKELPIARGIEYHTILGDRGKGNSPSSSDGVVEYWSSHLPDASSQKVVPAAHSQAHQDDETIKEVKRILHERAKSR